MILPCQLHELAFLLLGYSAADCGRVLSIYILHIVFDLKVR